MAIQTHDWRKNILLDGFSPEELEEVSSLFTEVRVNTGDLLIQEGKKEELFFFITSGTLAVLKDGLQIGVLSQGDVVGELAILETTPRIASVKALEPAVTLAVNVHKLSNHLITKFANNLSYLCSMRLSSTDLMTAQSLQRDLSQNKKRAMLGITANRTAIGATVYHLAISQSFKYIPPVALSILTASILCLVLSWFCYDAHKQGYSLNRYGMTIRNWKRSVIETFIFTIPLLLGIVIFKKALISTTTVYAGQPLFRFGLGLSGLTSHQLLFAYIAFAIYLLFIPAQDFFFRGFLQNSWERFASGPYRTVIAVFVSSIIYIDAHFYLTFSFLVFLPSFLWGWLFARHRTLIGISMGHTLLSFWAFWVVGISL